MWDEIILLGTIQLLQRQEKQIYISAFNPSWLKKFLSQFVDTDEIIFLKEIPKWFRSFFSFIKNKNSKILKRYKEVDSVIIWWWEILTEEVPSTYWYWLVSIFPCIIKKWKKTDIYLMWGIQVPKNSINRKLFDYLMSKVSYVYARDLESVYELKKYWFENAEFFMDTSYFAFNWHVLAKEEKENWKYIIVNINKNGEKFLNDIIKDIKYYIEEWYKVLYVPVAKWKSNDYSDMNYYKEIKKQCKNNDKFEILDREENFEKFAIKISRAEIVISTRLHLFLISNFLWTRTKVYPYQKKILKMQEVIRNLI